MRVLPVLMSGALLAGCATTTSESGDGRAAAYKVAAEAFRSPPQAETVQPSPISSPVRLQSQIEAMSHAELARWILPAADAQRVISTSLHRNMTGRVGAISLSPAPQRTAMRGLCELRGWTASLRVPNESSLTYQQHLNPPLQPYQYRPTILWKVAWSTQAAGGRAEDCAGALPGEAWFEAPSAEAAFRAANVVEQAQQNPGRFRIFCTQWVYDEKRQDTVFPRCSNSAALLRQLSPKLIKRVQRVECTSETGASPRGCLMIEYQDPASPGTHSFYGVKFVDEPRPRVIQIAQGMMPPH